jgi:hypothetical protein
MSGYEEFSKRLKPYRLLASLRLLPAAAPVPRMVADGSNWLIRRFQRVT